jgi:hypothetical protein
MPQICYRPTYPRLAHNRRQDSGGSRGVKCSKYYSQYMRPVTRNVRPRLFFQVMQRWTHFCGYRVLDWHIPCDRSLHLHVMVPQGWDNISHGFVAPYIMLQGMTQAVRWRFTNVIVFPGHYLFILCNYYLQKVPQAVPKLSVMSWPYLCVCVYPLCTAWHMSSIR